VEEGYAKNSGGSPSALSYVSITEAGRAMLEMFDLDQAAIPNQYFERGRQDWLAGRSWTANPYPEGTPERDEWFGGWCYEGWGDQPTNH
jgi:ribosome modulation factor